MVWTSWPILAIGEKVEIRLGATGRLFKVFLAALRDRVRLAAVRVIETSPRMQLTFP